MIGLNYKSTSMSLNGCINDINSMKKICLNYLSMKEDNIIVMHDNLDDDSEYYPTKDNIKKNLIKLVGKCKSGDTLFLHYSGHGVKSVSLEQEECIYPADAINGQIKNYFCVNDISTILSKLDTNANLFVLSDSCNSKAIVDFTYIVKNTNDKNNFNLSVKNSQTYPESAQMVCLTATSDEGKAYDVIDKDGKAYGILTNAFCELVKTYIENSKPPYYLDILSDISISTLKYKQTPMLSFSKQACLTCALSLLLK